MNTVVRIALRNVIRHKRRALITAVTMMVGIGFFVGLDSVYNGLDRLSIDNMINLRDSSVKIFTSAYDADRESFPLDKGIPDPVRLSASLRKDPRVVAVTTRTRFLAQAGNYRDTMYVVGTVVDPQSDPRVFSLKDALIGSWLAPGPEGVRQIVVGKELAGRLGLKLGDAVVLAASTRYEAQNADEFTIVGLLSTSDPSLNKGTVFISSTAADDFLDLGGLVTELDVRLRPRVSLSGLLSDASSVASTMTVGTAGLVAYPFQELNKGSLSVLKQKRVWGYMIMLFILLISSVGIVNTVLMSVYERIREVGVLRALGFRGREVWRMFILEGFFVGCVGSLLGAAFGILINCYSISVGFPLQGLGESTGAGFAFWGTLHGEWNPGSIVFAVVFGMVVAMIASAIPARKAARMTATAALRFV